MLLLYALENSFIFNIKFPKRLSFLDKQIKAAYGNIFCGFYDRLIHQMYCLAPEIPNKFVLQFILLKLHRMPPTSAHSIYIL